MNPIVIDPGKTTGVALFLKGQSSPIVASWDSPSATEIMAFLRWAKLAGFDTLVIEDQHLPRPRVVAGKIKWALNWPNMQTLILGANRWIVCAELVGLRIEKVKSAEWQGPMLGKVGKGETKRACSRELAKLWQYLRRWYPKKGELPTDDVVVKASQLNEHIRDAAMMGRWWVLYGANR